MTWNVKKCHILEPESSAPPGSYFLSGQKMRVSTSAEYLGVTLKRGALATDRNIQRVKAARQRIGMLKAAGINRKQISISTLLNICRTFVYPVADYAIHLMPVKKDGSCDLGTELELLDYKVAEYALGCIDKEPPLNKRKGGRIAGRLPRHLKIGKIPDWLQRVRMQLRSLERRLRSRARFKSSDDLAKADALKFRCFRTENSSPSNMDRKDLYTAWQRLCRGRRSGIPIPDKANQAEEWLRRNTHSSAGRPLLTIPRHENETAHTLAGCSGHGPDRRHGKSAIGRRVADAELRRHHGR